jgi:hypothetical protein
MAGEEGFEPPNAGTKTQCLTTWPLPNTGAFRARHTRRNEQNARGDYTRLRAFYQAHRHHKLFYGIVARALSGAHATEQMEALP